MSASVTVRVAVTQRVADLQLVEVLAERVGRRSRGVGAPRSQCAGDGGEHGGRALHRGALQVVLHAADAAQLLAAAGAAGAAVDQDRERRAVAGGFLGRSRG